MFDLVNMHQSVLEALRLEVSVELDRRRLLEHTTHIGWAPSEFTYAVWEKVS